MTSKHAFLKAISYRWIYHNSLPAPALPPDQAELSTGPVALPSSQPEESTGPAEKDSKPPPSMVSGDTVSFLHLTLVWPFSPQLLQVTRLPTQNISKRILNVNTQSTHSLEAWGIVSTRDRTRRSCGIALWTCPWAGCTHLHGGPLHRSCGIGPSSPRYSPWTCGPLCHN